MSGLSSTTGLLGFDVVLAPDAQRRCVHCAGVWEDKARAGRRWRNCAESLSSGGRRSRYPDLCRNLNDSIVEAARTATVTRKQATSNEETKVTAQLGIVPAATLTGRLRREAFLVWPHLGQCSYERDLRVGRHQA